MDQLMVAIIIARAGVCVVFQCSPLTVRTHANENIS